MAQVNKNTLKEYFQTGNIPNQQDFSDLIDSLVNIQDDSSTVKTMYESNSNTNNFTDAEKSSLSDLNSGATLANDDTKFATQKQAKDAINALDTDLQSQINDLEDSLFATVDTISALRSYDTTNLNEGDKLEVLGYYTVGDGGGGFFYWDSTSTDPDDNGVTIRPDSYTTQGLFKRLVINDKISVKSFGLGIGDDTSTFQTIMNNFSIVVVDKDVVLTITDQINIEQSINLIIDGTINFTPSSNNVDLFQINDTSNVSIRGSGKLHQTNKGSYTGNTACRFVNQSNSADITNIIISGIKVDSFSSHGISFRGANLSPIQDYDITSLTDLESRKGFKNIIITNNFISNCGGTGAFVYGNSEFISFSNNVVLGCDGSGLYADIYCKKVNFSNNVTDSNIIFEGGSEIIIVDGNFCKKIWGSFGTITASTGENGEPHVSANKVIITSNISFNSDDDSLAYGIQLSGSVGSAALTNPPDVYTAPLSSRTYVENFIVSNNIIFNSNFSGIRVSIGKYGIIEGNQVISCGVAASGDRHGIDIYDTEHCSIKGNIIQDTQNGRSVYVRGDVSFGSKYIDIINNTIYYRDDGTSKSVSEIEFDDNTSYCSIGNNTFDSNANILIKTNATQNLTVNPSKYIIQPTSYVSFGSGTTVVKPMQVFSDLMPLNTANTTLANLYLKQDETSPKDHYPFFITGARLIFDKPHSSGSASNVLIGTTNDNDYIMTSTTADTTTASIIGYIQELTLTRRKVDGDYPLTVRSDGAGTTDATAKFQIDYALF